MPRKLDEFETVGGALLDHEKGEALSEGELDRALAAVDAEKQASVVAILIGSMPYRPRCANSPPKSRTRCQRRAVAGNDAPPWGAIAKLWNSCASSRQRDSRHAHEGTEYTLVLTGASAISAAGSCKGDLAISDARHTHRPMRRRTKLHRFVVTTAEVRFKGPLGWLQRASLWDAVDHS